MDMHHGEANSPARRKASARKKKVDRPNKNAPRYSVGLPPRIATQVERYAETVDTSMSKAIAALVRLGLENQENRKREFFRKLRANLAENDPGQQDRLVDEFRNLILGR